MMTGKLLAHFVLFLSSLVYLAAGDDGVVLDLVVVPFEGQGQENAITTNLLYLEVNNDLEVNNGQIRWDPESDEGVCAGTTIPQPHGGGGNLFLAQDTAKNWKIRVRTTPGSYLVFDSPPQELFLSFLFGDTGDGSMEGTVAIEESPSERFEIKTQLAEWSEDEEGNDGNNLLVKLTLDAPDNDCIVLDDGLHGHWFVFSVNEPLYEGSYSFSPCNSYIRFEDGSHTVTAKRATRRLEWNEENPGRFLEEGTCPYCINGGTCPCCPDPNDGNSTAEVTPQDDNEVAEPPEEQPSRRAFIIGYTMGGVAIAAVLILSLLIIYNVMKEDKSSVAVPNTGDDDNAAANNGGDDVES